jgi:F0F1-type ATP synthase epsilon subunit
MPKMTHWNSPEPIDVPGEKAAIYAAQGWVSVDAKPAKVQPATAMTTDAVDESPAKPAKKAAAKKTAAKKSSK